jgi:hypothetical protein
MVVMLGEIIVTQYADRALHFTLVAGGTYSIDRSAKNNLALSLAVTAFTKNAYLEEVLKTRVLYFFNIRCYDVTIRVIF